jgi:hypothetical protein
MTYLRFHNLHLGPHYLAPGIGKAERRCTPQRNAERDGLIPCLIRLSIHIMTHLHVDYQRPPVSEQMEEDGLFVPDHVSLACTEITVLAHRGSHAVMGCNIPDCLLTLLI